LSFLGLAMPLKPQIDELALAVGHAITRWANLELALLRTFSTATSIPTPTVGALFRHIKPKPTVWINFRPDASYPC
jgi:hypothetical protein